MKRSIPLPGLRAIREARGIQQDALAGLAGCDEATVRKIQNGQMDASRQLAKNLATALGVTVEELEGKPTPRERALSIVEATGGVFYPLGEREPDFPIQFEVGLLLTSSQPLTIVGFECRLFRQGAGAERVFAWNQKPGRVIRAEVLMGTDGERSPSIRQGPSSFEINGAVVGIGGNFRDLITPHRCEAGSVVRLYYTRVCRPGPGERPWVYGGMPALECTAAILLEAETTPVLETWTLDCTDSTNEIVIRD